MPYGSPLRPAVAPGREASERAVRPVATVTTGGPGNPLVSTLEDSMNLLLSLLAVVLLAAVIFVGYQFWILLRGRRRTLWPPEITGTTGER